MREAPMFTRSTIVLFSLGLLGTASTATAASSNGVNTYAGKLAPQETKKVSLRLEPMVVRSTKITIRRGYLDTAKDRVIAVAKDGDGNEILRCLPSDIFCEVTLKPSKETIVLIGLKNVSTDQAATYEVSIEDVM
jgi:hypothetical protein